MGHPVCLNTILHIIYATNVFLKAAGKKHIYLVITTVMSLTEVRVLILEKHDIFSQIKNDKTYFNQI